MPCRSLVLFPPEDEVIQTEHIERCHTGYKAHPDISYPAVAHAGRHDPGCYPQKDLDVKDLSIPSVRHGRRQ